MAGTPLKRQRRKELRCIQPRIPMHQWRSFSDTEKIIAIFGMSLDEVLELMSIPFAEADLHERNLKLRVFECMMKAGLQFTRDRKHANGRSKILDAALRRSQLLKANSVGCEENAKLRAVSEARCNLLAARSTA